jgi:hypothetical protein
MRDESKDIGFFRAHHVTVPWDAVHPEAVSFVRYVPHSDLVEAEQTIASLRKTDTLPPARGTCATCKHWLVGMRSPSWLNQCGEIRAGTQHPPQDGSGFCWRHEANG